MKKKLSVLLIGSLVAISLAGCSGANTPAETVSVPSDVSAESTVSSESTVNSDVSENKNEASSKTEDSESETSNEVSQNEDSSEKTEESSEITGPEEGDIIVDEEGNEYIYHEDSEILISDEESMPVTSDGKEEQPKYLDVTFTPIDVNDKNVEPDVINMSAPEYYLISSTDELNDFVSKYERTFSLNDVENGVPFNTIAEKFDDTYFEYMSVVVIPAEYDKDTETEIGTITIQDDDYVIEVCTQPASSADKINRLCFVVQTYKSDMEGKNIVIKVVENDVVEGTEEEI